MGGTALSDQSTISTSASNQTLGLAFNTDAGFGFKLNCMRFGVPLTRISALESASGCGPHRWWAQAGGAPGGMTSTPAVA